VWARFDQL
jgi:pimeloyl-ACP methyl ester carboxylesterase